MSGDRSYEILIEHVAAQNLRKPETLIRVPEVDIKVARLQIPMSTIKTYFLQNSLESLHMYRTILAVPFFSTC
jgi:hypothetical protein